MTKNNIVNPNIDPPDLLHDFPFDATYGMMLSDLLNVGTPPVPEDFDAFWQKRFGEAISIEVNAVCLREAEGTPETRVWEMEYQSTGNVTIGGWLTRPRKGPVSRGLVVNHGYGGRDAPDVDFPVRDAALLFPCARGISKSIMPNVPSRSEEHVLQGIDHRETYIIGGCVADIWCGASSLEQLVPECTGNIGYFGGSFGGGIGALALPWDARFRAAHFGVPTFGNHPLRLRMPCVGSGEAVRLYAQLHPDIIDNVLPYFDSAIAATRIYTPVLVAAAMFDPVVPPPGQFSVFNSLAGPRSLYVLTAAHFAYDASSDEESALRTELGDFFDLHLPAQS